MSLTEPRLEERPVQHYVGIPATVPMAQLPTVIPQLMGETFAWLNQRQTPPAGPPLIRWLVIDMERAVEIEIGVPVAEPAAGDARVKPGVLPAGRYLTAVHTGPYGEQLMHATAEFLDWAAQHGIVWQTTRRGADQVWGARVEFYPTDPQQEPDPEKWQTELAFLTAS
jgi:effector-binding domain-containing protein